jgi:hypothetical protein
MRKSLIISTFLTNNFNLKKKNLKSLGVFKEEVRSRDSRQRGKEISLETFSLNTKLGWVLG